MDNCNRSGTGTGTGTGAVLSVRIATIDHVLVAPGPLDRQVAPFLSASVTDSSTSAMTRLPKVPVLRVFGTYQLAVNANANANANAGSTTNATTASARAKARAKAACVHIHGVYPYLLVKYTYTGGADQLQAFIHRLGTAINTALSLSASHASRSRPQGAPPNPSSQPHSQSASQPDQEVLPELPPPTPPIDNLRHPNDTHKVQPHVIAIHPIRALPFYGYHTHPHVYLKIHLVDPTLLTRLAQLLASGAILHTPMQPLESHFPYHLQFLADHALDGMGWMHLSDALARPPSHAQGVPEWNTARYPTAGQRATYCDLEVDVHACMIVNYHTRQREWRRTSAASGLSPLQSLTQATTTHGPSPSSPASRFLISSLDAIWDEEARRRSALGLPAYSTPPSESRTHVESPCDKPRWTSELDAVFAARNAREHTQADLVDPEGHQALDAIPWIQESVSFLWPTGFRPDLAAAAAPEAAQVQPVVDQGHEGFGHDAAWRMYPDLVAFSQRAHAALSQRAPSQQDSEDTDKITPPASQNVDEMGDQVDLRLTQQVLEQMLAQESQDVESEIEDDFGDAKVPNGGHDQEHAHGFGLMDDDDDAVFQAAADQFDNFQPLNDHDDMAVDSDPPRQVQHDDSDDDFDLDDHPSFRPSHPPTTTTIPQFNGPGDSSGNDDDAVAPPPRKRHRRKGPPLHKFADTLPPDLPTFSAIANEHLARQDADDLELDSIPCVSVPLGTWSPRDDAEVWSPARPRAGSRAHSEWRLMTGAHELLAGGKDNEARASRADVTYVPSTLPSTRSPETVQASCSTSLDQVDTSVLVDVEHQISPTPRPGPERRLPMLPPTQIPSRRPSALGPASPFIAARPLPGLHVYALSPPTVTECEQALLAANLPLEIHQPPFYGDIKDAHIAARARTFAGREYKIPLHIKGDVSKLPPFSRVTAGVGSKSASSPGSAICGPAAAFWTYARAPPSVAEAVRACALKLPTNVQVQPRRAHAKNLSQLEKYPGGYSQAASPDVSQMATPGKVGGRGRAGGTSAAELVGEPNALLCLGVEVHANSRGELMPDPAVDAVQAVTWVLYSDAGVETDGGETYLWGVLSVDAEKDHRHLAPSRTQVFATEADMFQGLIALTRKWDPDALLGYELHGGSWGYLIERCHRIYGFDLTLDLARTITRRTQLDTRTLNAWGYRKGSSFSVAGRLILNVWRLLRSEINLTDYSLESTVAHVLKRRFPRFPPSLLTRWYTDPRTRHRTVQVCVRRTLACMQLMVAGSYLDRTAEFARVYGIEFMGVLTRGSQYRVEAVMMRLARRLGYILLSPTRQQVAAQRAAECTPLVMEPESALYVDPVVVLDFQSLYPSIMIAYNLCFSTCVGKLVRGGKEVAAKLGCDEAYEMPRGLARDKVTVTPNGVMFVKSSERGGLLGKLLVELLETRVMVKQSIKLYKDNKAMTRLLDFRQLSLKLLANVIYGYCAASFSGRMPMVELGDAVVQTGRETLERGIQLINSHPDWRARVVYGDTDSLFIELKGATKPHAFSIGQAISRAVSALNPQPIHLKFEKVYLPCILVTKKRYIGHKYESPDQSEPDFDAKGIETVRRDGCPATGIIMKTALEVLFVHRDVSKVKAYVTRQFSKLMEGRIPIKDLIIAKEVKLGKYSDRVLPPPGAYLSMQKMRADPRTEPQYGQRVPYIVAYGAPGDRLIDQVMCPRDVLKHAEFRVHAHYYISKQIIPALTRLFQLFGADIGEWYAEMPKVAGKVVGQAAADSVKRITLDQYYQSRHCAVCDMVVPAARVRSLQAKNGGGGSGNNSAFVLVCDTCRANPGKLARKVLGKVRAAEMRYKALAQLCTDCIELGPLGVEDIECDSLACAVLYDRVKAARARRAAMQAAVQVGVVGSSDGAETAVVEIDD